MMLLPHIQQAFNLDQLALDPSKNPLAGKLNFNVKPNEPKKIPTPQNMNTTGISIAHGNYLNTSQKPDGSNQPTWKTLAGNSAFLEGNAFLAGNSAFYE